MQHPNPSPGKPDPTQDAMPNAWLSLLGIPCGAPTNPESAASGEAAEGPPALPTETYSPQTFGVLHQALLALRADLRGPGLDALTDGLQRLSQQCDCIARDWAAIGDEPGLHPVIQLLRDAEKVRARAIADSVNEVWALARARAMGDLDSCELNAQWFRLWDEVTVPDASPDREMSSPEGSRRAATPEPPQDNCL